MSTAISTIKFNNTGIKDNSAITLQPSQETTAQFTPLFPLMTEKGPEDLQVINVDQFRHIYGDKSLEVNGPYYTHQTSALVECIRKGISTVAVKRVIPPTARKASLGVGIDTVFPGQWVADNIQLAHVDGGFEPIMEITTSSKGKWGNEYGAYITEADARQIARLQLLENVKVYNFRLVKYDPHTFRYTPILNRYGELETQFTLKPQTLSRSGIDYFFNEQIHANYIHVNDDEAKVPVIAEAKFNIDTFKKVAQASSKYDRSKALWDQEIHTLYDKEHVGFRLFKDEHPLQFMGGDDGINTRSMTYVTEALQRLKVYDDTVFEFLDSLTDGNPFTDLAKYPYTTIIDTGFSYRTKLAVTTFLNTRRDCWAMMSTFMVADHTTDGSGKEIFAYVPKQTEQQRQAIGARLTSAFRLFPDSHKFGTAAFRTIITKNTGIQKNSEDYSRQSMNVYLAGELAAYMGSPDEIWRENYAIDNESNRIIDGWTDIDVGYQAPTIREMDATNSLTAVENFDRKRQYIPYIRTIYPNHTSVLADFLTMCACCFLDRLGARAWRTYLNVPMTDAKRMETIIEFINRGVENKFNNRFEFIPRVTFSTRGVLSEDVVVEIHAPKLKVSTDFTIETNRRQ